MHATTADSPTTTSETRAQAVGAFQHGRRGGRRRARVDSGRAKPPAARHPRHQRRRPARTEIEEAALRILARRGGQILATARRYAATPEDADDAYQRGLEILLTKAPSTSEEELVPWLKTVVLDTICSPDPQSGSAHVRPTRESSHGGGGPYR
jgi:hypothetical protein